MPLLEIDNAIDRVVAGMEGQDSKSKRLIAYHEVGRTPLLKSNPDLLTPVESHLSAT